MPRFLYLHGFASGPRSTKGLAFAEHFASRGAAVERLDLRVPSFEHLRLSAMLDTAQRALGAGRDRAVVFGSSLGGLTAARLAERDPRVTGLVLLVVLLAVRLMATVWDNARLVQQEAAMQAEKLEALRRIAGGISHEFNNMLTTVIGHAELGLSEVDPGSRVEQDLEGIRVAADRAARLTRDLLAYSGGQFVGRVPFDFAAELRRLLPRVEEALGPRVSLAHEIAGDPLWVNGDADQLGALVLTLARHAERRLPDGGRVLLRLTAVVVDTSRGTAADPLVPGRYLQLQLSDTGPSLPPEMLSRIFEPYFPAESHSRVPELGLAAVHGIATAHRAGLTVESGDPQGLTITLLLPAVRR